MGNSTGQRFVDINGKTKEIRIFKDSNGRKTKGHSGNLNYILTSDGVIHHNARKVVNRTKHLCGINKMM